MTERCVVVVVCTKAQAEEMTVMEHRAEDIGRCIREARTAKSAAGVGND